MATQQELGLLPQWVFGHLVANPHLPDVCRSHLKIHMKKHTHHALLLALALVSLSLTACQKPGPAQEAGRKIDEAAEQAAHTVHQNLDRAKSSTQADIQHVDTAVSDADITAKGKLALMMRDGLNSLTISVTTQAGVVTLSGSVVSTAQSQLAQELARAVNDVKHVNNQLTVVSAVQPIDKAKA
jgi:hyperosmotically inducible periplasmic protein